MQSLHIYVWTLNLEKKKKKKKIKLKPLLDTQWASNSLLTVMSLLFFFCFFFSKWIPYPTNQYMVMSLNYYALLTDTWYCIGHPVKIELIK